MRARWLAVAVATLALAGCSQQSHTGLVLSVNDVGDRESYSRWGDGWVLAVPRDAGNPNEYPGPRVRSLAEWGEVGEAALVGRDGGFDLAIEQGMYWMCFASLADDVDALYLGTCQEVTVFPGEVRIELSMRGVRILSP